MELNINSPAYFSREYGIDDEVYHLCRDITSYMKDKSYSNKVRIIGITPIITPNDIKEQGKYNDSMSTLFKSEVFSVFKSIDFDTYLKADSSERKKLVVSNILESVKDVSAKVKFEYSVFKSDLNEFIDSRH